MQFPVLQAREKERAVKVRVLRECEFAHIKPLRRASSLLNGIFEPSTYSRAASVVIQWRPRCSAARAVVPDPAKGSKTISSGRLRNSIILDANAIGIRAGWAGRAASRHALVEAWSPEFGFWNMLGAMLPPLSTEKGRMSVVEGKRVSGRVEHGGGRAIKKNRKEK